MRQINSNQNFQNHPLMRGSPLQAPVQLHTRPTWKLHQVNSWLFMYYPNYCIQCVLMYFVFSEHTAAEALLLLQELGMASKSDKATQVNTQHECLTKFRISELIVTDAQLNTFTGIPTHQLFDSIVTIVERYENENKMEASVADRVLLVFIVLKQATSFSCLSVLFQCSISSVHRYFVHTLPLVAAVLQSAIEWPTKEEVLNNMPVHFEKYSRCSRLYRNSR